MAAGAIPRPEPWTSAADQIAREAARRGGTRPEAAVGFWRAAGTGVLVAVGSVATAAVGLLLTGFLFLAVSGRDALRVDHGPAEWVLAAGFGLAAAAALLAMTANRPPRPLTVALAALAPAAAWLSGHPLPGLLASTLFIGLALARDRTRPGRPRPAVTAAFTVAATACVAASLAGAQTTRSAPRESAPTQAGVDGGRSSTPRAHHGAAPAHPPRREPAAASPAATPPAAALPESPSPPSAPAAPSPPAPRAAPRNAASPAGLVAAYYAALDARRFGDAWAVLGPSVRRGFGGLAHWRAGFATTLSSRPRRIVVTERAPGVWEVRNVLVARDRTPCGRTLARRFAVNWRIARRAGGRWSVTALTAAALTGPSPCG